MTRLVPLVRPSVRTIRWASLGAVAALSFVVVWTGSRRGGDPASIALPVATTLLGVWLCFLFEDTAAEITATSPTPLALRRVVRVGLALPVAGVAWVSLLWIGPLAGPTAPSAAAFGATVLVALAAAAFATRVVGPARAPLVAAATLVATILILPIALPPLFGHPPSIDPARPPFGDPRSYPATIAAVAAVALALAHLDPARPSVRSRREPRGAGRRAAAVAARGSR